MCPSFVHRHTKRLWLADFVDLLNDEGLHPSPHIWYLIKRFNMRGSVLELLEKYTQRRHHFRRGAHPMCFQVSDLLFIIDIYVDGMSDEQLIDRIIKYIFVPENSKYKQITSSILNMIFDLPIEKKPGRYLHACDQQAEN